MCEDRGGGVVRVDIQRSVDRFLFRRGEHWWAGIVCSRGPAGAGNWMQRWGCLRTEMDRMLIITRDLESLYRDPAIAC